jgi:hypothetical protein
VWTGEVAALAGNGSVLNGATTSGAFTSIGFDGATAEETESDFSLGATGQVLPFGVTLYKSGLSEGYHFATLIGRSATGNTQVWTGSGTTGTRSTLRAYLKL